VANTDRLTGGELDSALTNELVGVHTGYLGHGPKTASTFYRGNVVVTVMHDVLTKAEKILAQTGRHGDVSEARGILHQEMETDFRAVVERLTGRKVLAFLSANQIEPDVAAAIFILDDAV
jgi:uncharacterized protein YbcI